MIALRSYMHVQPNPFAASSAFYAGDTGGAIVGLHVDMHDWRGRAAQLAWGKRIVGYSQADPVWVGPTVVPSALVAVTL